MPAATTAVCARCLDVCDSGQGGGVTDTTRSLRVIVALGCTLTLISTWKRFKNILKSIVAHVSWMPVCALNSSADQKGAADQACDAVFMIVYVSGKT